LQHQPRGDGLIKAQAAAQRLGVHPSMISSWYKQGLISGYQPKPRSPLWVSLQQEDIRRLDGSLPLDKNMIPLKQAAKIYGISADELRDTIRAGRLKAVRIFKKNYWHWFVSPVPDTPNPIHYDQ
jgi:predicted site-specific integrase-resolvase